MSDRDEHLGRQRRARAAAADAELDGLVVWSQRTWHGDVTYLSGHQASFPQLPDSTAWSGKSASALVLPVTGDPVLLVDTPFAPEQLHVDDVRTELFLARGVARAVRERGLDGRRLGLVGSTVLRHSAALELQAGLDPATQLVAADELIERLRMVKSPWELERLRQAASVGVDWMRTMLEAIEPGRTEGDIVGEGLRFLASKGGYASDVIVASGHPARPNSRGVPSWDATRPLESGDLVRIDAFGPVTAVTTRTSRARPLSAGSPTTSSGRCSRRRSGWSRRSQPRCSPVRRSGACTTRA